MTATLTISSRNYSSWSLRGWLICQLAGLEVREEIVPIDTETRAELLLLSSSVRVPRLTHEDVSVWDVLAIANYLNELYPDAGLYPEDRVARARCRSICGEMHSGFFNLRSALPMNLKSRHESFKVFSGARPDIQRIEQIWGDCLTRYGGPFLFGAAPTIADAMFAPVATRFVTYNVAIGEAAAAYRDTIMAWPLMRRWIDAALAEPEEMAELDGGF
ncbi:glutathione S-transferase [Sphingomonas naphthae]|uniref:Glutathione S-transferase n=1 Tax=Sphingomonas naphthae TaxID=1813468 RepID=A0ABY7TH59_9SPHN|nr:glutathione S-transferase [Sphingomonas naphthae]WCT72285.1 glutathione S-transferase [Sphingomonas naphthae]